MEEPATNPEVAVQPVRRRRHSKEFKAEVMRAAMQPHVSIAAVALHYRLNASLNKGRFIWTNGDLMIATALNPEQLQALVMGLPWRTLAHGHAITVV